MKKSGSISKTYLKRKADKVYSEYWRKLIPFCECCGRRDSLQLAHIISRGCIRLRYEPKNKFILCWSCHWKFHSKPLEFTMFVEKKKGKGSAKKLIREAHSLSPLGKDFYHGVIEKYKKLSTSQPIDR